MFYKIFLHSTFCIKRQVKVCIYCFRYAIFTYYLECIAIGILFAVFAFKFSRGCEKTTFNAGCGHKAKKARPDHSAPEKHVVPKQKNRDSLYDLKIHLRQRGGKIQLQFHLFHLFRPRDHYGPAGKQGREISRKSGAKPWFFAGNRGFFRKVNGTAATLYQLPSFSEETRMTGQSAAPKKTRWVFFGAAFCPVIHF